MTAIPLGRADFRRDVAKVPHVLLRNRYFESNPILTEDQVSLLARPGIRWALAVGDGPIRQVYTCPGAFGEDLFVVSGVTLFRVQAGTFAVTEIGDIGVAITDSVNMAATGNIGEVPGHLFVCDGGVLWCYTDDGYASGHLQASGAVANNDVIRIGSIYYKWTNASVDAGTPDGTVANPWLVALGPDTPTALDNMFHAINDTGLPGTDYSTLLEKHPTATAYSVAAADLYVRAATNGTLGNGIVTTETGANIAWGGGTMSGGGAPSLFQVPTPDDVGAISLAHLNSFIIVVPVQGNGVNGRFFWIEPGETTIDPLNYATAERAPDAVYQVVVFGDQFWLCGQTTTETWYMTGDPDAPMLRTQGVLFDHGTWQGTAIQVDDSLIMVDSTGRVFDVSGQQEEISTPDIVERIRRAQEIQSLSGL